MWGACHCHACMQEGRSEGGGAAGKGGGILYTKADVLEEGVRWLSLYSRGSNNTGHWQMVRVVVVEGKADACREAGAFVT